ncbi:MAG: DUF5667 domain-containing protein [Candidatus Jorgensenbacteria bacterium]|nr:DUF5667 domain-containing protein [Candidatus Jorgensenbacteria bacterium]
MKEKIKKFLKQNWFKVGLLIILVTPFSVSAAPGAGIKPTSIFYFLDIASEKVSLFFTLSHEQRAQKNLFYAEERLAEAETSAEEKNSDAVKTAITNYESNIALASEESKQVENKQKAGELFTSITDNISKQQEVLSRVLIKVPEETKETITQAIEVSKKSQEEATKQTAELNSEIEQLKQEIIELKAKSEAETIKAGTEGLSVEEREQAIQIETERQRLQAEKAKENTILFSQEKSQIAPPQKVQSITLPKTQSTQPPVRKTYPIIPLGDISNLSKIQQQQITGLYVEFNKVSDLQFLTQEEQNAIWKPIIDKYITEQSSRILYQAQQQSAQQAELDRQASQRAAQQAELDRQASQQAQINAALQAQINVQREKNNEMKALTQQYNTQMVAFDQQIIDITTKYYSDVAGIKTRAVPEVFRQQDIQSAAIKADTQIAQIRLLQQQLYLDYSTKINAFQ